MPQLVLSWLLVIFNRLSQSFLVDQTEEKTDKTAYAPRFNPGLSDLSVRAGGHISLRCTVDAIPVATVLWYKDGLPLKSDGRVRIERDDNGNCMLTIDNALESDDGAYRVTASNEHGTINTACNVIVKGKHE